jgi:hypothetical protein
MLARSLVALFVVAALVAAPTVSRARLFCRMTGTEVLPKDCADEPPDDAQAIVAERCCEQRLDVSLGAARLEASSSAIDVPTPVVVGELCWADVFPAAPLRDRGGPPASRAPLSVTHILLI